MKYTCTTENWSMVYNRQVVLQAQSACKLGLCSGFVLKTQSITRSTYSFFKIIFPKLNILQNMNLLSLLLLPFEGTALVHQSFRNSDMFWSLHLKKYSKFWLIIRILDFLQNWFVWWRGLLCCTFSHFFICGQQKIRYGTKKMELTLTADNSFKFWNISTIFSPKPLEILGHV